MTKTSNETSKSMRRKFSRIASAGVLFQGGLAAIDTNTFVAALVHSLTGSVFAVGAAAAISRYGWLFPQIIVAHLAQKSRRRMGFYAFGAFGRVGCLLLIAALMVFGGRFPISYTVGLFFLFWTLYAFVSGTVAVPYNDIVARSIPSSHRSRLLALRFFGGGLLALAVTALAHRILDGVSFPSSYALLFTLGAALMVFSALSFLWAGESTAPPSEGHTGFGAFLLGGLAVFREDHRFRLYLYTRWLAGLVGMAGPLYIVQVKTASGVLQDVAFFFGMQTLGNLLSNPLWGWWGDHWGKARLHVPVAMLGFVAPAITLVWFGADWHHRDAILMVFGIVFLVMGAVSNGDTIAHLGMLMEISPDGRRPAYSGYFSMFVAPAALLPLVGGVLAEFYSLAVVFALSLGASLLQVLAIWRLLTFKPGGRD